MRHLSSSALRILAVAACLAYGTARAEPLAYDELNAPQPPLDWYGWQILLVDLASTAAIVGGSVAAQDGGTAIAIPIVGGAGYLAGGPLVHLAHGEGDRATRSALLRAFVPLGAGALGAGLGALSAGSGSNEICASNPRLRGGFRCLARGQRGHADRDGGRLGDGCIGPAVLLTTSAVIVSTGGAHLDAARSGGASHDSHAGGPILTTQFRCDEGEAGAATASRALRCVS